MSDEDFIYYEQYDRLFKEYGVRNRITGKCDEVYDRLKKENELIITSDKHFSIYLYFIILTHY